MSALVLPLGDDSAVGRHDPMPTLRPLHRACPRVAGLVVTAAERARRRIGLLIRHELTTPPRLRRLSQGVVADAAPVRPHQPPPTPSLPTTGGGDAQRPRATHRRPPGGAGHSTRGRTAMIGPNGTTSRAGDGRAQDISTVVVS